MTPDAGAPGSLAALRRLVPKRQPDEACELCSEAIGEDHPHLYDPSKRELICCCRGCGLLFSSKEAARYRLVPSEVRALPDFVMDEELWTELAIPVNMAFMQYSSPAQRVVAYYPSPAGATESLLTLDNWQQLVDQNPPLRTLEPDVQALLIDRIVVDQPLVFMAPIDQCYRLVGLVRAHWHGLSGGTEVWKQIKIFFDDLKARSR